MEQLKSYMAENAITHEGMSDLIGVSRPFVTQILNGARYPGWRIQLRIEAATKGHVTPSVWMQDRSGCAALVKPVKPVTPIEIEP
jgi:DNA-binding transcriptional regulator YdaS (Cro superfamily)